MFHMERRSSNTPITIIIKISANCFQDLGKERGILEKIKENRLEKYQKWTDSDRNKGRIKMIKKATHLNRLKKKKNPAPMDLITGREGREGVALILSLLFERKKR